MVPGTEFPTSQLGDRQANVLSKLQQVNVDDINQLIIVFDKS